MAGKFERTLDSDGSRNRHFANRTGSWNHLSERILIVEDSHLLAIDLQETVEQLGFPTSGIARDFESARRLAPHSDIALVDVNLADGETGPRIGQYLADEFGIAVVMITANLDAIDGGISGVVGVVSKPANPTTIRRVLEYLRGLRSGVTSLAPPALRLFAPHGIQTSTVWRRERNG